jgi:hypothetical protein
MIFSTTIKALRGRRRWLKIKRKYSIYKSGIYVIMMPDSDCEFNEFALRHIDDFLNYRKGNSVVILTTDKWVADNAKRFSERIAAVELITQHDYCYYYCYYYHYYYYGFSEQFIMMSLQGVYGKRLALLENMRGITKEDMVCLGLYMIRNWVGYEAQNG